MKKALKPSSPASLRPHLEGLLRHKDWVYRLARSLVSDATRADDVVQQVWLAALKYRPSQDRDIRPWLAVVARDAARKLGRTEARLSRREKKAAKDEALLAESALLEKEDTRRKLVAYVEDLEEPYRSTILMHFFEELRFEEIAKRLNVPSATVRTRLRRGLEKLRQRLEKQFRDPGHWIVFVAPLAIDAPSAASALPLAQAAKASASALKGAWQGATAVSLKAVATVTIAAAAVVAPPVARFTMSGGPEASPPARTASASAGDSSFHDEATRSSEAGSERSPVEESGGRKSSRFSAASESADKAAPKKALPYKVTKVPQKMQPVRPVPKEDTPDADREN